MPVNLEIHKPDKSDQSAENSTLKKVKTQIDQLEDWIPKRRKIRADAIKLLREIFQTDSDRLRVFGDYYDKAHSYFAEDPWYKVTYLGSDSTLLKLLREVQKNSSR